MPLRKPMATALSDRARDDFATGKPVPQLRDYSIGAQILLDLGVHDMILLSNTAQTIIGLEGYGLSVVECHPLVLES